MTTTTPLLLLLLLLPPFSLQQLKGGEGEDSSSGPSTTPTLTYPCPHTQNQGPPPSSDLHPTLPDQFMTHVEAQLVQKHMTIEAVQVFDYPNNRAAMSITSNNETVTSIFSYGTGERLDILSNGTCLTRNLTEVSFNVFGFTELKASGRPHIMPVTDVFRWGEEFEKVFIGEDSVRGLSVYHWQSCQTIKDNGQTRAAFVIDYYFSKPGHITATGDSMIPVRALINGTAINVDLEGRSVGGTHDFSHVYDFSFFRPGPIDDETLFEVPRGTVCRRRLSKTLPQLPDQFSLSMEVQVGGRGHPPRTERMLFDYDFKLIQTERFAPRGTGEKFGLTELTIVEDYNNHVQYVIDSYDGNCTVSPLPEDLSTSDGGLGQQITMKHAQELLKFGQRDFKYQGQRLLRDMKVDVWADATEDGMVQEVYFLADWPTAHLRSKLSALSLDIDLSRMNMLVGTYLLNTSAIRTDPGPFFHLFQDKALKPWGDRWQSQRFQKMSSSSSSSSSSLPEPGDLLRLRMAKRRMHWDSARMHFPDVSEKMINIFNYLPMHMDLAAFDVSMCYKKNAQEMFVFFNIEGTYASVVTDQRYLFLSAVRSTVASAAGVSMLRVNNINVWQDLVSNKLSILFSMLQPPSVFFSEDPARQQQQQQQQQQQLSCQDAFHNLQGKVQDGLTISVRHPLKKHDLQVIPDSLQNWGSPDELWRKVLPMPQAGGKGAGGTAAGQDGGSPEADRSTSGSTEASSSSGYTSGQFGGMAFAMLVLGMLVGVGGMYLVLRRVRPDIHLLPYQQSR